MRELELFYISGVVGIPDWSSRSFVCNVDLLLDPTILDMTSGRRRSFIGVYTKSTGGVIQTIKVVYYHILKTGYSIKGPYWFQLAPS